MHERNMCSLLRGQAETGRRTETHRVFLLLIPAVGALFSTASVAGDRRTKRSGMDCLFSTSIYWRVWTPGGVPRFFIVLLGVQTKRSFWNSLRPLLLRWKKSVHSPVRQRGKDYRHTCVYMGVYAISGKYTPYIYIYIYMTSISVCSFA